MIATVRIHVTPEQGKIARRVGAVLAAVACVAVADPSVAQAVSGLTLSPNPVVAGAAITFASTCDPAQGGRVFIGTAASTALGGQGSYTFTGSTDTRSFTVPAGTTPGTYYTSLTCTGGGIFDKSFSVVAVPPAPVADPAVAIGSIAVLAGGLVVVRRRRSAHAS
jgi:hypothetical protein